MGDFAVVTDPAVVHLPIEAYLVSAEQVHAYNAAQRILANKCLERYGFEPDPLVGDFSATDAVVASLTARRYMLSDPDLAAQFGYHTGLTPAFVQQDEEHAAKIAKAAAHAPADSGLLAARGRVLLGQDADSAAIEDGSVPTGGCVGEANRQLRDADSGIDWAPTARQIQVDSYDGSLADPRMTQLFASWSACMAERGFAYATPIDANADPAWSTEAPSDRERATAAADVECKTKLNVIGVWFGVESELQKAMIEQHITELSDVQQANKRDLASAAAIVQGSGAQ